MSTRLWLAAGCAMLGASAALAEPNAWLFRDDDACIAAGPGERGCRGVGSDGGAGPSGARPGAATLEGWAVSAGPVDRGPGRERGRPEFVLLPRGDDEWVRTTPLEVGVSGGRELASRYFSVGDSEGVADVPVPGSERADDETFTELLYGGWEALSRPEAAFRR